MILRLDIPRISSPRYVVRWARSFWLSPVKEEALDISEDHLDQAEERLKYWIELLELGETTISRE